MSTPISVDPNVPRCMVSQERLPDFSKDSHAGSMVAVAIGLVHGEERQGCHVADPQVKADVTGESP